MSQVLGVRGLLQVPELNRHRAAQRGERMMAGSGWHNADRGRGVGILSRRRARVRFYGTCLACGNDWREHAGGSFNPVRAHLRWSVHEVQPWGS